VFVTVSNFKSTQIYGGKARSQPLELSTVRGLYSGKFQPCQQILDQGGSDWQWQTL